MLDINKYIKEDKEYINLKNNIIDVADKMDIVDKLDLYMESIISQIANKHDFNIVIKNEENKNYWLNGYDGTITLMKKGIHNPKNRISDSCAIFYNHKYHNGKFIEDTIQSFEDFISKDNFKIIDLGENWKNNGYAKRVFISLDGIYRKVWLNQIK